MDTTVRTYLSTMSGAPTMSGEAGKLITLLDKCLVDGFGTVTLTSLVVASDVATATVSGGHGFSMMACGLLGPVVRIAGATPGGLNGDWRILSVVSSTQFIFATSGISDQTATGTITAKIAPMDWVKLYSGTNKAVYQRPAGSGATAMLLRVDDTGTTSATAIMYETMTDVDTGSGLAPTSGSVYARKSASADATVRPWRLVSDPLLFYGFFDASSNSVGSGGLAFGDIISYTPGDAYHAFLCGGQSNNTSTYLPFLQGANSDNTYLSRAYDQVGVAVKCVKNSHAPLAYLGDSTYVSTTQTNPADGRIHLWPVTCQDDTTGTIRGELPGLFCPMHALPDGAAWAHSDGRILLAQGMYDANKRGVLLLEGPWR